MDMRIQNVLFDMDGVLLDSEEAIRTACIEALKEYGISAQHEDFFPFTGMGRGSFYRRSGGEIRGALLFGDERARLFHLWGDCRRAGDSF